MSSSSYSKKIGSDKLVMHYGKILLIFFWSLLIPFAIQAIFPFLDAQRIRSEHSREHDKKEVVYVGEKLTFPINAGKITALSKYYAGTLKSILYDDSGKLIEQTIQEIPRKWKDEMSFQIEQGKYLVGSEVNLQLSSPRIQIPDSANTAIDLRISWNITYPYIPPRSRFFTNEFVSGEETRHFYVLPSSARPSFLARQIATWEMITTHIIEVCLIPFSLFRMTRELIAFCLLYIVTIGYIKKRGAWKMSMDTFIQKKGYPLYFSVIGVVGGLLCSFFKRSLSYLLFYLSTFTKLDEFRIAAISVIDYWPARILITTAFGLIIGLAIGMLMNKDNIQTKRTP